MAIERDARGRFTFNDGPRTSDTRAELDALTRRKILRAERQIAEAEAENRVLQVQVDNLRQSGGTAARTLRAQAPLLKRMARRNLRIRLLSERVLELTRSLKNGR